MSAGEFARRALCLDCLRAPNLTDLKCDAGDPPGRCPECNGQTCDCKSCLFTIAELEAGNLKPDGIVGPGLASWTAAGGGVDIASPNPCVAEARKETANV